MDASDPSDLLRQGVPPHNHGEGVHPHPQRVTAHDNVTEAMKKAKVTPNASQLYLYWGEPQVIHLKFKCTGSPKITRVRYPTRETAKQKGKAHLQFNLLYYCRVQLAEQRSSSMAAVDC